MNKEAIEYQIFYDCEDRVKWIEFFTINKKGNKVIYMSFDYKIYLQTHIWQELRNKVIREKCFICNTKENLEVHHEHHWIPDWKKSPSVICSIIEDEKDLHTLCRECHQIVTEAGWYLGKEPSVYTFKTIFERYKEKWYSLLQNNKKFLLIKEIVQRSAK